MDAKFWQAAAATLQQRIKLKDLFKALGLAGSGAEPELIPLLEAVNSFIAAMDSPEAKAIETKLAAQVKAVMDKADPIINLAQLPWFTDLATVLSDKTIKAAIDGAGVTLADLDQERRRLERKLNTPLSWQDFASNYSPATGRRRQSYLEKYLKASRIKAARQGQPAPEQQPKDFYQPPTSQEMTLINTLFTYSGNLTTFKRREEAQNRAASVELIGSDGITYSKGGKTVKVAIRGLANLEGSPSKGVTKIFNYLMLKINNEAYHGKQLAKGTIQLRLQELVDNGHYKTIDSAYHQLERALDILEDLKLYISMPAKGKKQVTALSGAAGTSRPFVKHTKQGSGEYTIFLDTQAPWQMLFAYFTILPKYYFSLPGRGAKLLQYIFNQARQHVDKIADSGGFTVGMASIQKVLGLPDIEGAAKPYRDIAGAIEAAIDCIADAEHQMHTEPQLLLTPVVDASAGVKGYLDGYLQVVLQGDYKERFTSLAQVKTRKIAAAKRRRERLQSKKSGT